MAAKTPEEFSDDLDAAFAWRRVELHALKSQVSSLIDAELSRPYPRMILRASVALTYAHWEGFTKQACQHYVDYIAQRRLKFRDLHPELAATSLRPILEKSIKNRADLLALAAGIADMPDERARIPRVGVVETGSNLRFERLTEMLSALGLSREPYATRQHLIDVRLCDMRNEIAHGAATLPTKNGALELLGLVLEMMDTLRTQLTNSIAARDYRQKPANTGHVA